MSGKLKFAELDVLKSQEPGIEKYSRELSDFDGVTTVKISVVEIDAKTETLQIAIEGKDIELDRIKEKIKELGGTVHSVDMVISSKKKLSGTAFLGSE